MDPVTVFSLAGSILKFLDSGTRFVELAWRLYRSGPDERADRSELFGVTSNLEEYLKSPTSLQNDGIGKLAEDCNKVASKLLNVLQKVKIPDNPRKRDALKAAFRLMWKGDEIKSLQLKLDSVRGDLSVHLLLSLRQHAAQSAEQQAETLRTIGVVEGDLSKQEDIASSVLSYIASKTDSSHRSHHLDSLRSGIIKSIYTGGQNAEETASDIQILPSQKKNFQEYLLDNLRYSGMADRRSRIADPHQATFHWVLQEEAEQDKNWSNLSQWLATSDQLYWVTGKAGSGKSTLIKFLCEPIDKSRWKNDADDFALQSSSRCHSFLAQWAGNFDLIIASFYFWNSGAQLQMRQEGLLLSLLNQIFSQRPDVIPSAIPRRWESLCLLGYIPDVWTMLELQEALLLASKALAKDAKLCLFVDGLDEFDGDHNVLIALFKELVQTYAHVKICVASRPWVVFQDAFGSEPNLRLEDLTYNDIKLFVTAKFADDPEFSKLQKREPSFANQLIEDIVSKASGVFLWVHLVVASLLAGMTFGDRVSDLQKRLELLPPGLEDLYNKILQSLDPFYLEHAAQFFTLLEVAEQPLTIMQFAFADEESPESVVKISIDWLAEEDQKLRIDAMVRRLNSRCKGLLEVDRGQYAVQQGASRLLDPNVTVQYLHRTVKDFIQSPKVQTLLQSSIKADFDPHFRLCIAFLAYTKTIAHSPTHLDYANTVRPCLQNAARVLPKNEKDTILLIDDLSKTLDIFCDRSMRTEPTRPDQVDKTHRQNCLENLLSTAWDTDVEIGCIGHSFLSLTIVNGILCYVRAKAPHGGLIQIQNPRDPNETFSWPLLCDALCRAVPNCEMVECILALGADPNLIIPEIAKMAGYPKDTPWHLVLELVKPFCKDIEERGEMSREWVKLIDLMIAYGADKSVLPRSLSSSCYSRKRIKELQQAVRKEGTKSQTKAREGGWLSFRRWSQRRRFWLQKNQVDVDEASCLTSSTQDK